LNHFEAICIDLDDTLWDLPPVIRRAEEVVYAWMERHFPAVTRRYSPAAVRALRQQVAAEYPERRHDLSFLRLQAFTLLAQRAGCPVEMASQAFEVFQQARNQVTLFDDVEPALRRLACSHRLLALTNGNADLHAIGLADYFERVFTARALGVAKPDPQVFRLVCRAVGLSPGAVLHVGNDPEDDIEAARIGGMGTAWVNRRGLHWPGAFARPDHEIADLYGLVELAAT